MESVHELQKSELLVQDKSTTTHIKLLDDVLDFAKNHPAETLAAGMIGTAAIYSAGKLALRTAQRLCFTDVERAVVSPMEILEGRVLKGHESIGPLSPIPNITIGHDLNYPPGIRGLLR